ncbi:MAG: FAD-binding oxidoreductase [Proteobacteria bacterium]|nr:FAD-binding oxidoreductase [Pseudomonadota bacterium]
MATDNEPYDFIIVGAGIAGASIGWELAAQRRVLLLERESQPGYHTTGRSAALYSATYGTPHIRALTRASRAFYDAPPPEFGTSPILTPRGVVYLAGPDQLDLLDAAYAEALALDPHVRRLAREQMLALVPCLRPEAVAAGMSEPGAADIDVHALHQGYLRGLRQRGGAIRCNAEVTGLQRLDDGWRVTLAGGETITAGAVVNAAGAWADVVAALAGVPAIGLEPRRRTAFTFPVPAGMDASGWPAVIGIDESYYFKPDAGQLLGSPANADPVAPHDVVPEELDVALGLHRIEAVTSFQIRRPSHAWAGLRSFVADGDLVIGWDNHVRGFFWLAAQGGYGIQSAAGAALLARQLALNEPLSASLVEEGVTRAALSPARLR